MSIIPQLKKKLKQQVLTKASLAFWKTLHSVGGRDLNLSMSQPLLGEAGSEVWGGPALAKPSAKATSTRNHAAVMAKSQLLSWLHGSAF